MNDLPDFELWPVGHLPTIQPQVGKNAWRYIAQSHGTMICEMAIYASQLPEGHLDAMFERIAEELVYSWIDKNDPNVLPSKFGELIYCCSEESQFPKTGNLNISVETQGCEILRIAAEVDPRGDRMPAGYPCAFHEKLAQKVAEITDLKVVVNTSSTGCIVTLSIE